MKKIVIYTKKIQDMMTVGYILSINDEGKPNGFMEELAESNSPIVAGLTVLDKYLGKVNGDTVTYVCDKTIKPISARSSTNPDIQDLRDSIRARINVNNIKLEKGSNKTDKENVKFYEKLRDLSMNHKRKTEDKKMIVPVVLNVPKSKESLAKELGAVVHKNSSGRFEYLCSTRDKDKFKEFILTEEDLKARKEKEEELKDTREYKNKDNNKVINGKMDEYVSISNFLGNNADTEDKIKTSSEGHIDDSMEDTDISSIGEKLLNQSTSNSKKEKGSSSEKFNSWYKEDIQDSILIEASDNWEDNSSKYVSVTKVNSNFVEKLNVILKTKNTSNYGKYDNISYNQVGNNKILCYVGDIYNSEDKKFLFYVKLCNSIKEYLGEEVNITVKNIYKSEVINDVTILVEGDE